MADSELSPDDPPRQRPISNVGIDIQQESMVKKWGPWLFAFLAASAFLWSSWLEPRLSQTFMTVKKGKEVQVKVITNSTSIGKLDKRVNVIENNFVWVKGGLDEIKQILLQQKGSK